MRKQIIVSFPYYNVQSQAHLIVGDALSDVDHVVVGMVVVDFSLAAWFGIRIQYVHSDHNMSTLPMESWWGDGCSFEMAVLFESWVVVAWHIGSRVLE